LLAQCRLDPRLCLQRVGARRRTERGALADQVADLLDPLRLFARDVALRRRALILDDRIARVADERVDREQHLGTADPHTRIRPRDLARHLAEVEQHLRRADLRPWTQGSRHPAVIAAAGAFQRHRRCIRRTPCRTWCGNQQDTENKRHCAGKIRVDHDIPVPFMPTRKGQRSLTNLIKSIDDKILNWVYILPSLDFYTT
jgi:hypothetical protein